MIVFVPSKLLSTHPSLQLANGYTANGPEMKEVINLIDATGQSGTAEKLKQFPSDN